MNLNIHLDHCRVLTVAADNIKVVIEDTFMEYHHGNLKEILLQFSLEELDNKQEDISLRQLSQRAGVSHNAPYRHFKSKSELINQLIFKIVHDWVQQMDMAQTLYPASIRLQIQYTARVVALTTRRHPHRARLVLSTPAQEQLPSYQLAHRLLEQNIESLLRFELGKQLRADCPIKSLTFQILAALRGACLIYLTQENTDKLANYDSLSELIDTMIEALLKPYEL